MALRCSSLGILAGTDLRDGPKVRTLGTDPRYGPWVRTWGTDPRNGPWGTDLQKRRKGHCGNPSLRYCAYAECLTSRIWINLDGFWINLDEFWINRPRDSFAHRREGNCGNPQIDRHDESKQQRRLGHSVNGGTTTGAKPWGAGIIVWSGRRIWTKVTGGWKPREQQITSI